ncbi:MAG: hypothetical protein DRQ78_08875 [Epsilonproteobacteria bacterium]|nr:MAG: hypothetical protein DRQ78_08875 [Campylobacterota bacterium]
MAHNIPEITESSRFNLITSIWIVPFIALMVAGWLAYQYFAGRGPEIRILFSQNEGLVAGQSVVKFRNVPVGKVTKILIEEDIQGVVVVVRMNTKESEPYMTEYAKFWIVKPEVGFKGISGLDTILSGTYIDLFSKEGGTFKEEHIGLTHAYHDSSGGEYFHLKSFDGDNISVGTPIYYKNIQVGKVEYINLSLDSKSIDIIVFIDKPYVPYVHDDSKFWTKNTVNVNFSKGNLDVNIAPLNYMLQGGILFSSSGESKNNPVSERHIFPLYKSRARAEAQSLGSAVNIIEKFILLTDKPVANLPLGADVRFDGFDVGHVSDIKISYSQKTHKMQGSIVLEIDTSVFEDKHESNVSGLDNLYAAVASGLRAQIATLDPITGMLFIDLTFKHKEGKGNIIKSGRYAQLPMVAENNIDIATSIGKVLDKLNALPLEALLSSIQKVVEESSTPMDNANALLLELRETAKNLNKLTNKKSFEVLPDELTKALREMTDTLQSTKKVVKGYDSNSLVKQQLAQTLEVLTKTSQEMQVFLRMLNRKPNSLIFGDN